MYLSVKITVPVEGMLILKAPFTSVLPPIEVPFTPTLTPTSGSPAPEETLPVRDRVWAKTDPHSNSHAINESKSLFISNLVGLIKSGLNNKLSFKKANALLMMTVVKLYNWFELKRIGYRLKFLFLNKYSHSVEYNEAYALQNVGNRSRKRLHGL